MNTRRTILVAIPVALTLVASALRTPTKGSMIPSSPAAAVANPLQNFAQVRSEYIQLYGNNDVTDTAITLVNRSLTTTIQLGEIYAVGTGGLSDVLSTHTAHDGFSLAPLASIDLAVQSTNFPGLQPKIYADSLGLETVVVAYTGPREALRLLATIEKQLPGDQDTRVVSRIDGHCLVK